MNTAMHTVEVPFPQAFVLLRVPVPVCPTVHEKRSAPVERDRQAVRRACDLRRDVTLALSLFLGQHGRVFPSGPQPVNPPKHSSVCNVLLFSSLTACQKKN